MRPDTVAIALIVALWGRTVLSYTALSLTADKTFVDVGDELITSPVQSLVSKFFFVAIIVIASAVILFRMNEIPRVGLWRLGIVIFPWLWMVIRDTYSSYVGPDMLLYILVILALAGLRPSPRVLAVLGVLIGITAIGAILFGVFLPDAGLLRDTSGAVRDSDKETFTGHGLLQGMFTSENNLGQYLVLGLPFVGLIRRNWLRISLVVIVVFATWWSSSRGALSTLATEVGIAVVLYVLVQFGRRMTASVVGRITIAVAAAVGVWLPLQHWDPEAFTQRALIWNGSLAEWLRYAPTFGFDSDWYTVIGKMATSPLNSAAYHAHNEFVQLGVTGGIVFVLLAGVWYGAISWFISSARSRYLIVSVTLMVGILVSGYLEVPIGFVDRSQFWAITVLPLVLLFFAKPEPADSLSENGGFTRASFTQNAEPSYSN